ncbi:hypothetical protein RY27_25290, partial [Litorilinea aerophila]
MRKLLFVVALLMLLVVAGCAAPAQPAADTGQAAPATGGEEAAEAAEAPLLRFGINAADLGTLDPHFASSTNDRTVVSMIFNGLVRYKP